VAGVADAVCKDERGRRAVRSTAHDVPVCHATPPHGAQHAGGVSVCVWLTDAGEKSSGSAGDGGRPGQVVETDPAGRSPWPRRTACHVAFRTARRESLHSLKDVNNHAAAANHRPEQTSHIYCRTKAKGGLEKEQVVFFVEKTVTMYSDASACVREAGVASAAAGLMFGPRQRLNRCPRQYSCCL
jgi:hypothetical protein